MSVMAEQVDRAITDYGACAGCSINGWITWHAGPCPVLVAEARANHPSTFEQEDA